MARRRRRYYDNYEYDYDSGYGGYGWFRPSRPRRVESGIKPRSGARGKLGASWWAGKWVGLLDSFGWSNRLQRGRSYARNGQVLDIKIGAGKVSASVQGSRPSPYKVQIAIAPLSDAQWQRAIKAMGAQAAFSAKLLAGEMPQNIEEAFATAGVPLLPTSPREMEASCNCPDFANPCKHIAAVHYILAEQFDADPFIIFQLRGRKREQVLAALRAGRAPQSRAKTAASQPPVEELESLGAHLADFWTVGAPLDAVRVTVEPPALELALLRRLGAPPFWRGPHDFTERMSAVYAAVTRAALDAVRA